MPKVLLHQVIADRGAGEQLNEKTGNLFKRILVS